MKIKNNPFRNLGISRPTLKGFRKSSIKILN